MNRKQCTKCKVNLPLSHFKKTRAETYTKLCMQCLDVIARARQCKHGKRKSTCKQCGGSSICPHNRIKSKCKDCKGGSICLHNREKSTCRQCGGSSICPHDRIKSQCKQCKGGSFCQHGKRKSICKDCGGSSICPHNRIKSRCRQCGGSSICPHNREKSICKDCKGGSICQHGRLKYQCKDCDLTGYLTSLTRKRVYHALKAKKSKRTFDYLGADIQTIKDHIERTFEIGMTWENIGKWHIDHIVPIKYSEDGKPPSHMEQIRRRHYKNLQAMWGEENISKGNRFIGKDERTYFCPCGMDVRVVSKNRHEDSLEHRNNEAELLNYS
eukprot:Lithocolla_globosa_v1_NODE_3157_length_1747_cov_96.966312.p1 type:complete len:326 gc:universal NODE_3157_length_1747_cov_96.966312:1209-232(-)